MSISKYTKRVNKEEYVTTYSGYLDLSGAEFFVTIEGDGNSTTYSIGIEGGQFDIHEPFQITVMGEWEMMELFEIMKLISPKNESR